MFKKNVDLVSTKIKTLEDSNLLSVYLGKKVLSRTGISIGKVYDVVISNDVMVGIMVQGKRRMFIDKEFFKSDFEGIIMLTVDPVPLVIGKTVYDSQGKKLGKVIGIERKDNANTFTSIILKKTFFFQNHLQYLEKI